MIRAQTIINISIFFILLFCISCGTESFVEPEFLNTPFNLIAYPKNGQIKVKFYSSNKEDKFDGFNIYISQSSSLKYQTDLLPIKNPSTGGIPSINSTSKDINPLQPIELTISRDQDDKPLENGIRYYFIVKAHSIRNYKSEPSNETYTTPRIDNLEGVIIYENGGFNFEAQDKVTPYDIKFEITGGKPYLVAQNSALIQSKGYFEDWELVNQANEDGYVDSTTPLLMETGHVFLIKTSDSHYAKIQISALNLSPIPYIKIIWAYQQNSNNKDI